MKLVFISLLYEIISFNGRSALFFFTNNLSHIFQINPLYVRLLRGPARLDAWATAPTQEHHTDHLVKSA